MLYLSFCQINLISIYCLIAIGYYEKKLLSAALLGLRCGTHIYPRNPISNADDAMLTKNFIICKVI
jgi:hypothetical protein